MSFLEIIAHLFFWLLMISGIIMIPLGIPGTFVIAAAALVYAWLTEFAAMTLGFVGLLFLIAMLVEVLEFSLGALTAAKYGSSKMGIIGSILGGFWGALWGIPILPPFGILVGAFIGAFAGAALFELIASRNWKQAFRVGWGALLGSVAGKIAKMAAAVAMVVMVGLRIL